MGNGQVSATERSGHTAWPTWKAAHWGWPGTPFLSTQQQPHNKRKYLFHLLHHPQQGRGELPKDPREGQGERVEAGRTRFYGTAYKREMIMFHLSVPESQLKGLLTVS